VDETLSTEVSQKDGATIIRVRGEIDIATCERLRDAPTRANMNQPR
jgi:anti-anti-sigma regulatory factor